MVVNCNGAINRVATITCYTIYLQPLTPGRGFNRFYNSGSLTSVYSVPVSAYTGAWFEYTAKGTTSLRAGNIASIFSGTSVNHNETTTTDIGDTSDLLLDVIISGTNATLTASATTSNWEIKTIIRSI